MIEILHFLSTIEVSDVVGSSIDLNEGGFSRLTEPVERAKLSLFSQLNGQYIKCYSNRMLVA